MRYQIIAALVIIAAILVVGSMDYDDEVKAQSVYCKSVAEWKQNGGHGGHPDYNGNYNEVCK